MWLVGLLLLVPACALCVPALVLLIECLAARATNAAAPVNAGPRPRTTIIVPAHDEQASIAIFLGSVAVFYLGWFLTQFGMRI